MFEKEIQSYLEHMDFLTEDQKEKVKNILKFAMVKAHKNGFQSAKEKILNLFK